MLLQIGTYICANGLCILHHNRSHRRISNYNWKKMKKWTNEIDNAIIKRANNIINIWLLKSATNSNKIESINITDTSRNPEAKVNKRNLSGKECDQCDYPRPEGAKHRHFIKRTTIIEDNRTLNTPKYLPIELVFSKIDKMAENNIETAKLKIIVDAPGKPIQLNCYRMSYGDLNYLGSKKAIFYFDRGIRGKRMFNNSMYPLEQQSKYKEHCSHWRNSIYISM